MLDALWALALSHIHEITAYVEQASEQAALSGRNLEPWQAIFAVALWLEEHGCIDIFQRMNNLSQVYQKERPDLEMADLTVLVIRALIQVVTGKSVSSISSVSSIKVEGSDSAKTHSATTGRLTEEAKRIAQDEEVDIEIERITSRRVGRVLAKLRIPKDPDTSIRQWRVIVADLARLALAFGIVSALDEYEKHEKQEGVPPDANACNASNACNACQDDDDDLPF
jgi:hypothetical protein